MTWLITTIVGTVVAAGALSATVTVPQPAADREAASSAPTAGNSTSTSSRVSVTIPVVAFSTPVLGAEGHLHVVALLTDPAVRAMVEITTSGSRVCGADLVQGTPTVLDCGLPPTGRLRASYALSDGRSGVVELVAR